MLYQNLMKMFSKFLVMIKQCGQNYVKIFDKNYP